MAGRLAAEQLGDAIGDRLGGAAWMATLHRSRDLFQAGTDGRDGLVAGLAADFLVGAAEDEQHPAGNDLAAFGVAQLMADGRQLIVFPRQGGAGLAAALLFDGEIAGLDPKQLLAMLLEKAR